MALTQSGRAPTSRTPSTRGIFRWNGSPAIASATSRPPAPMASMPSDPAEHVWLSEPSSMAPLTPNDSMCTGWLTPLPGRLYHRPNLRQALRKNRWSSALRKSSWSRSWSTYCTDRSARARPAPMASNSSMASVPVASWSSVCQTRSASSPPACMEPSSRWAAISFCARFIAIARISGLPIPSTEAFR